MRAVRDQYEVMHVGSEILYLDSGKENLMNLEAKICSALLNPRVNHSAFRLYVALAVAVSQEG